MCYYKNIQTKSSTKYSRGSN